MKSLLLASLALPLGACAARYPLATTTPALVGSPYAAATERLWAELTPLARFPSDDDYDANLAAARAAVAAWKNPFESPEGVFRDPEGVLTPDLRAALLDRIAEHAAVRSMRTPDAYRALIQREPAGVWLDVETFCMYRAWKRHFHETPPVGASEPYLDQVWDLMVEMGGRFDAIGAGAWSADLRARASTDGRHWDDWMREHEWGYETVFWSGQSALSCFAQFRAPARTIHDVIADHESAIAVDCLVRVQAENGVHAIWHTEWHYDPDAGEWLLDSSLPNYVTTTPML